METKKNEGKNEEEEEKEKEEEWGGRGGPSRISIKFDLLV